MGLQDGLEGRKAETSSEGRRKGVPGFQRGSGGGLGRMTAEGQAKPVGL